MVMGDDSQSHMILREVAPVAKEIIQISEQACKENSDLTDNIQHFPQVTKIADKQIVQFSDGTSKRVDIMIMCTGYKYTFPYLHESCGFKMVDAHGTYPLYKLTFNPHYPTMAFLGTLMNTTFAYHDMQIMWALRVWLGQQPLLHTAEMLADHKNGTDTGHKDLTALYKELASCSETRPPSPALLGILKQIGSQMEEKLKDCTVLSSEHWMFTYN